MDVAHVVESYLAYRQEHCKTSEEARSYDGLRQQGYRRVSAVLHPNTARCPSNYNDTTALSLEDVYSSRISLSPRRLVSLFERNLEVTLDRITSYILRHLTLNRVGNRHYKSVLKLCKFVCVFFRDLPRCGIKVKPRPVCFTKLVTLSSKGDAHYNRFPGHYHKYKKCLISALRCCLRLKGVLSGLHVKPWYMLQLMRRVNHYIKVVADSHQDEWIDLRNAKAIKSHGTGLLDDAAMFIVNILYNGSHKLPSHIMLQGNICQWQSFSHNYTKKMAHLILFMDYLFADTEHMKLLNGFRRTIHKNINIRLSIMDPCDFKPSVYNDICNQVYIIYAFLNCRRVFQELQRQFVPHSFVVEHMVSSGILSRANLEHGKSDVVHVMLPLMLTTQLLTSSKDLKHNTWLAIQIMTNFFHEGGVNYGMLRCPKSKPCFRCLIGFTNIACGMYTILKLFRRSSFYPSHIRLVKMLLKHSISKLRISFCNSSECSEEVCDVFLGFKEVANCQNDPSGSHGTPACLSFAVHLIRQRCLMLLSREVMKPKIRTTNIDAVVPHPIYLKLLFAVHDLNSVNVLPTVEAIMKGQRMHAIFDHLAFQVGSKPWLPHGFPITSRGRMHFQGYTSLLAQMYLHHKGLDDCLSDFIVKDNLSVIQRTQACHILAKNPHIVALILPQLVQSLYVDPGDRVWHLLVASLCNELVSQRVPYYLACMAHTTDNQAVAHKAVSFLELIIHAARDSGKLHQELRNIRMHSKLLELALHLATIDPAERQKTLCDGLTRVNKMFMGTCPVFLFDDDVEVNGYALCNRPSNGNHTTRIRSMDFETPRLLTSATRAPFMLDFHLEHDNTMRYIYKMDDDMRQDALVVQMKLFLMHVFRSYNLEAYLQPFLVVPYSTALSTVVKLRSASLEVTPSATTRAYTRNDVSNAVSILFTEDSVQCMQPDTMETNEAGKNTPTMLQSSYHDPTDNDPDTSEPDSTTSFVNNAAIQNRWCAGCRPLWFADGYIPDNLQGVIGYTHILGGIVGFIPGAISRHAIGREYGGSLEDYFVLKFGPRGSISFLRAMDNFINSLAGYSLLCFLLQVKDRHNGNLMISSGGHIVHIDYGFILGSSPAADVHFEQAPFKLTKEMTDLLGGVESNNFQRYVRLLVASYLCVRQESTTLVAFVKLLEHSGMTCFRRNSVEKLRQRLYLHATPERAAAYMLKKIHGALHSKTTMVYDMVQAWQQGIAH
ncbi:phosphatidylinositol 4-kinase [Babesia ovis]|uniref:Phosphatidylinositol 4-kinase n=1 Tax=Babesia ovis TaxID=5869 RepID=A0A9W5TB50_BABOV|nr:phosphatidylinositol 4-kinase [Babesia ovis]